MLKAKHMLTAFAVLGTMLFAGAAEAAWPERPVTVITQGQAGSFLDLSTRRAADMLAKELGQPFVVVNQTGAGGNVAVNAFLQTKNDGYTILSTANGVLGYNLVTMKVRYAYDDIQPVDLIGTMSGLMIANPASGWKSVKDAYDACKKENRALKASVSSNYYRDVFLKIGAREGVKVNPVPAKANPESMTAVMGGHADIAIVGTVAVEAAKAGKLTALAVPSGSRLPAMPDIPTLQEQGYPFDMTSDFVFFFQKDAPADIVEAFISAFDKIKARPEYAEMLKTFEMDMGPLGREGAVQFCKEQYEQAKVIAEQK
ncbi:MAG: tripartite tricarboxylate transporter substrate binding protein [Mailhella sp.]|nr:tripartite tricarboxylate transporter substrate binding protein [Mailhella sp.]